MFTLKTLSGILILNNLIKTLNWITRMTYIGNINNQSTRTIVTGGGSPVVSEPTAVLSSHAHDDCEIIATGTFGLFVWDYIDEWLKSLGKTTSRAYYYYMNNLIDRGFFPNHTIDRFASVNLELIVDKIKAYEGWTENVRQTRAKVFISFTRFLSRRTHGKTRIAIAKRGVGATFVKPREKAATEALSRQEWAKFIFELRNISHRESLIARCLFQGAKRVSEVLNIKTTDIDYEKNTINFTQLKTSGTLKMIPVSFPPEFLFELKAYIDATENYRDHNRWVFVSKFKKKLGRTAVGDAFKLAASNAGIQHVHPHMLRATWVTEALRQGTDPLDMMIVTGHTGLNMISYYDKRAIEDNVTKKLRMF